MDVKSIDNGEKLIQIKVEDILKNRIEDEREEDDDEIRSNKNDYNERERENILWIKENNLSKYFDYFLLICYREQSVWTTKKSSFAHKN